MKKNKCNQFLLLAFLAGFITVFVGCSDDKLPDIKVHPGSANISGSITNLKLNKGDKSVYISFIVKNPIEGSEMRYNAFTDKNNKFHIDIPLETTTAIIGFLIESESYQYGIGIVGVNQSKKLLLNISFSDKAEMNLSMDGGINLSSDDALGIYKSYVKFNDFVTWGPYYKMTPKKFSEYELTVNLPKRIHAAIDSIKYTPPVKKFLENSFNLLYLKGRLFYYKKTAEQSFVMSKKSGHFTAKEPDKSYYTFLKQYNLNDPQFLYTYFYRDFMLKFLTIDVFKIPPINDTPVETWITEVSKNLKDIVGFNSGFFYDMLAAYSYAQQLTEQKVPLTKLQADHIAHYYQTRNKGIIGVLQNTNTQLLKSLNENKTYKIIENPQVSNDKLVETILSKYKGKMVLVDFWATWCGPCKDAFLDFLPFKKQMKNRDVAFVYLTNHSSPYEAWKNEIKTMGGDHYYLQNSAWEYLFDKYNFEYIPTFLIFNKKGELIFKTTGDPDMHIMQKMADLLMNKTDKIS